MDPVSQGVVGAAFAQAAAKRATVATVAWYGALGGMAPDLDVLFQSPTDPILFLEFHRQFTHSLVFIPVGALVVFLVLRAIAKSFSISPRPHGGTSLFGVSDGLRHPRFAGCLHVLRHATVVAVFQRAYRLGHHVHCRSFVYRSLGGFGCCSKPQQTPLAFLGCMRVDAQLLCFWLAAAGACGAGSESGGADPRA